MVEHCLAKAVVASSSLVSRSTSKANLVWFAFLLRLETKLELRSGVSTPQPFCLSDISPVSRGIPRFPLHFKTLATKQVFFVLSTRLELRSGVSTPQPFCLSDISPVSRGIPRFPLHFKSKPCLVCFFVTLKNETRTTFGR